MTNLLDITGDDIAELNDTDLRSLIGLLCEADYRSGDLSTRGITWGGHQDAADGGLDVVVRDEGEPPANSFVPKKHTGLQVKNPDMPRKKILEEMRPKGVLRDSIKELIQAGGAYLIVSSKASTTEKTRANRLNAMREAVENEENSQNLFVDFLDRGQVATWVRNHPSLILWVRNKIGRPLQGWRPYENWANAPGGIEEEYLLDDGLRLHDGTGSACEVLSAQDGLFRLRSALSSPRSSVRLVGLSGVGKTRLVQALFDERIGEQQLDSSLAIYTDISDSPLPEPGAMAEQLVASQSKIILIVDNCPPDLHRRLTTTCIQPDSAVSLLTVEYDVRDDLPEDTSVFKLEPASEEVISKLILKRFSHISQVDAQTIAKFSGGNARIALALANTLKRGESLSGLHDNELFKRLFWQRDPQQNENLLRSAEICSLVYSFEGADTTSEQSELQFLASFADKSAADLYRDVEKLKKRELVQSRSVWRAVLPQAIANWLARRALESIPKDVLVPKFEGAPERLMKSFTRRLGYLHDCDEVVKVVEAWLEPEGWIGKYVSNLSDSGMEVFVNIAPVSPAKTLAAIERATQETEEVFAKHQSRFVDLLQKLAYEPELFERCARLLCRVVLLEWQNEASSSRQYCDIFRSFFYLYFSGTHASVEERLKIIEELTFSQEQHKQELGFYFLEAALEAGHFGAMQEFSFGARRRNYGYQPGTHEDVVRWFETFIDICVNLALSGQQLAEKVRKLLAVTLGDIWINAQAFDAVEKAAKKLHAQTPWNEGWLVVRGIIRREKKSFTQESKDRLDSLAKHLEPIDLLELARTYAFSYHFDIYDNRTEEKTETVEIGIKVAQCPDVLNILLPELVSAEHNRRLYYFGRGLADGCSDRIELFRKLHAELAKTAPEKRQNSIFMGFLSLCAGNDLPLYNKLLDEIVKDDFMGEWLPIFQTISTIDQRGVERLHQALDIGKARIDRFECLAWGCAHESINDDDLAELLRKMLSKENGLDVVLEILNMRFYERKREYSAKLVEVSRNTLCIYPFKMDKYSQGQGSDDHRLTAVANVSLKGVDGVPVAKKIICRLAETIFEYQIYNIEYPDLLNIFARIYPKLFLDAFLGDDKVEEYKCKNFFRNEHNTLLDQIPDDVLLSWCAVDSEKRYPIAASVITRCSFSKETKQLEWKPIVFSIIEKAPDVKSVLKHFAGAIWPRRWGGSLADIMEKRAGLLQEFYEHKNETVRNWAKNQYVDLQEKIKTKRESEQKREEQYRLQDERFE